MQSASSIVSFAHSHALTCIMHLHSSPGPNLPPSLLFVHSSEVAQEIGPEGFEAPGAALVERLRAKVAASVEALASLLLQETFSALSEYARSTEEGREVSSALSEKVVRSFGSGWEKQISVIQGSLQKGLRSIPMGQAVLKEVMTQLLVNYRRFVSDLEQGGEEARQLAQRAAPVASIMFEIKRVTKIVA